MNSDKNKGFSLLEVLVTMIIIAITVISSFEFYAFCMRRLIMNARLSSIATDLGQETMEKMYFLSLGDSNLINSSEALNLEAGRPGTRSCNITAKPDYSIIETKVTWTQ